MLYLDVVRDDGHARLMDLAAASRAHFTEAGFTEGTDSRPFAPHVTIAKLSNLMKRGRHRSHIKSIPEV